MITIRKACPEDVSAIMEIYAFARSFMAGHGNPIQWGRTNWPPEDLIRTDIVAGKSYVCITDTEKGDEIMGVFYYDQGKDIEPTYDLIEGGTWLDDGPYGVIHRIRSTGILKTHGTSHQ